MDLKKHIREFSDFPKEGVLFRDISPVLKDHNLMNYVVDEFYCHYKDKNIDLIAGTESRGLVFASVLSQRFKIGSIMIRKKGKLPGLTEQISYDLEYGSAIMEIQVDAVSKGQNVLIVDDLLATGGTAHAAAQLIEKLGGNVAGFAFVIELENLKGRKKIEGYEQFVLTKYAE